MNPPFTYAAGPVDDEELPGAPPDWHQIGPYRLELTCSACPEQYDVWLGEEKVGYLRLRHGQFRADAPDCGGETVYEALPAGDGVFEKDERVHYLMRAIAAIDRHRRRL